MDEPTAGISDETLYEELVGERDERGRRRSRTDPSRPMALPSAVTVLGTDVVVTSGDEVLSELRKPTRSSRHLAYVNAHSLNLAYDRSDFRDALSRCDLVLNDGIGLKLAARMRGISIRENLNGSDFTFRILTVAAEQRWRVFLYGGVPGLGEIVNDRLRERLPELRVVGTCDGYSPANVAAKIRATEADVVLVALGQPEQELWLDSNLQDTGALLGVGVGAFLDFVSGRVVRAPPWMNRMGIEWLFRLVHEPKRLWRRYVVGNPLFLWRAWRLRRRESPARVGLGHKPGSPVQSGR